MESENSRYIQNTFDIKSFSLDYLQSETLNQLMLGMDDLLSVFSFSKPTNICSVPSQSSNKDDSIYTGYGGYLFLGLKLYRFSLNLKNNCFLQYYKQKLNSFQKFQENFNDDIFLKNCVDLLNAIKPLLDIPFKMKKQEITYLIGRSGMLVLMVFLAFYQTNQVLFQQSINQLLDILKYTLSYKGEMFHETLYGTTGLLHCFLELQNSFQSCEIKAFQVDFKEEIFKLTKFIYGCILNKTYDRFTVTFYNEEYLGAAHGLFGVLYIFLKAYELISDYMKAKDIDFEKKFIMTCLQTMEFCLALQFPSGNFSSTIDINEPDELIQYCHGSTGIIPVLLLGQKVLSKFKPEIEIKLIEAAIKAGEDLWKRGLLKKGFNLCHGISGNAYAFISLYNFTKDEKWLKRAYIFALSRGLDDKIDHIIKGYDSGVRLIAGMADHPYSLMEGLAGHLCLLIDLDPFGISKSKFPGFEI